MRVNAARSESAAAGVMRQALHIGFVCDEYPPGAHGGIGSFTRDLAEGLVTEGNSVTVAGNYGEPRRSEEEIRGVRFARLAKAPGFLRYRPGACLDRLRLYRRLSAENRRQPFDLIECPDFAGWLPCGTPGGVPLIVRFHGSNLFFDGELSRTGDAFEHSLEKKLLARADFLVSPSRYAAESTLKTAGFQGRHVTIIPHAVDSRLFRPESGEKNFEEGLIVYANSVNPKKGIQELCEAMNVVCRESPKARLVIAGGETYRPASGGSYREFLLDRVEPAYRERIEFAGRLDRETGVLPLLQRAHLCCYPSHMETFGLAPLEAMAVGKPVIYSRLGPGPEIIEDGVSGLLCDPRRPEEIASRILRILRDAELAAKLGTSARLRVLDLFEKEKWIARNAAYYETCLRAVSEGARGAGRRTHE